MIIPISAPIADPKIPIPMRMLPAGRVDAGFVIFTEAGCTGACEGAVAVAGAADSAGFSSFFPCPPETESAVPPEVGTAITAILGPTAGFTVPAGTGEAAATDAAGTPTLIGAGAGTSAGLAGAAPVGWATAGKET